MSHTLDSTPLADGYRMPAEWAHHSGCWLIWPERPDNWRQGGKPAQAAFTAVATAIATTEPVTVAVSFRQFDNARSELPPHIRVVEMTNDDAWIRDCGPTFVVNDAGDVRGVDWDFNAWGGLVDGLYFPWAADSRPRSFDLGAHGWNPLGLESPETSIPRRAPLPPPGPTRHSRAPRPQGRPVLSRPARLEHLRRPTQRQTAPATGGAVGDRRASTQWPNRSSQR